MLAIQPEGRRTDGAVPPQNHEWHEPWLSIAASSDLAHAAERKTVPISRLKSAATIDIENQRGERVAGIEPA